MEILIRNLANLKELAVSMILFWKQYGFGLQEFQPKLAPAEDHFVCTSQNVCSLQFSAGAGV